MVKILDNNNYILLDYIMNKHYLGRKPSISYAFGLYINNIICGVITFGKPASNSLCEGVCGKEYKSNVYELNRLIVDNDLPRNTLSKFVSSALKLLPRDLVVVSYSDSAMNHNGYIYQATNFIYTGKTKSRTDKYVPNGKHSRHYNDEHNHLRKYRSSKHRYIYFTGKNKKWLKRLKYKIEEYPKGRNDYYILGEKLKTKVINKNDDSISYE
jgi:hypothetical protein